MCIKLKLYKKQFDILLWVTDDTECSDNKPNETNNSIKIQIINTINTSRLNYWNAQAD